MYLHRQTQRGCNETKPTVSNKHLCPQLRFPILLPLLILNASTETNQKVKKLIFIAYLMRSERKWQVLTILPTVPVVKPMGAGQLSALVM